MKITNFILKTSKLLSISPSTIAEEAFSSPDHKVLPSIEKNCTYEFNTYYNWRGKIGKFVL